MNKIVIYGIMSSDGSYDSSNIAEIMCESKQLAEELIVKIKELSHFNSEFRKRLLEYNETLDKPNIYYPVFPQEALENLEELKVLQNIPKQKRSAGQTARLMKAQKIHEKNVKINDEALIARSAEIAKLNSARQELIKQFIIDNYRVPKGLEIVQVYAVPEILDEQNNPIFNYFGGCGDRHYWIEEFDLIKS